MTTNMERTAKNKNGLRRWAILRAVVLTQPRKHNQNNETEKNVNATEAFVKLQEEKGIYKQKLREVKETTQLANILTTISKQEKRRTEIANEMKQTESPNVAAIKHSQSTSDRNAYKKRGHAISQVRQKRAALGRAAAKKKATIESLQTKIQLIITEDSKPTKLKVRFNLSPSVYSEDRNNKHFDNESDKNMTILPPIQIKHKNIITKAKPQKNFNQKTIEHKKSKVQEIKKATRTDKNVPENKSYPVLIELLKRMELNLEKLNQYSASDLGNKAERIKNELNAIEDSIMKEIKSIRIKQKMEVRIQRMRVKYKDLVKRFYEKEKMRWVREEQQKAKLDKLNKERERLRKLRYQQFQVKMKRMKMEQEMFGFLANNRFTSRKFSYFS